MSHYSRSKQDCAAFNCLEYGFSNFTPRIGVSWRVVFGNQASFLRKKYDDFTFRYREQAFYENGFYANKPEEKSTRQLTPILGANSEILYASSADWEDVHGVL